MTLTKQKELLQMINEAMDEAIRITEADKGNFQLYNKEENTLRIVAQRGFNRQFLEYFRTVTSGYSACGVALKRRERVIIQDVFTDKDFGHLWPVFSAYGFIAVQSTPLVRADQSVLGVTSTHFAKPFTPTKEKLQSLDAHWETFQSRLKQHEDELQGLPALTDID